MKTWPPEEIKALRTCMNLSQKDFAEQIGVRRQYVNYLERGVKKPGKTLMILLTLLEERKNKKRKAGGAGGS